MPGRGGHGKGGLPSLAIQVIHPIQLIQAYSGLFRPFSLYTPFVNK